MIRLGYRDPDRTPVIFCIEEMARRFYDVDVDVVRIRDARGFEAALFDGTCDVIIEHLEYLYAEAARGRQISMFCCPVRRTDLELVAPAHVGGPSDLRGKRVAVRDRGRPHVATLRLRAMGLEELVTPVIVRDLDVGRWCQWKAVEREDCAAAFISAEYLPPALEAGLKVLPTPDIPLVGHFHQACLTAFAYENDGVLRRYVAAVIHAICLMKLCRDEAMEIVSREPMRLMEIEDLRELRRRVDCIAERLEVKPYPTPEAIANTYEVALTEWPGARGVNPLSLWDLHWVKQLDSEGFIGNLVAEMSR